jgi:serine/threonine protein phosphatase PrpC
MYFPHIILGASLERTPSGIHREVRHALQYAKSISDNVTVVYVDLDESAYEKKDESKDVSDE